MSATSTTLQSLLAVAFCILGTGCDETESPTLCVFTADELGNQRPEDFACPNPGEASDDARCPVAVSAGTTVYIRGQLPEGVAAPEPLHVQVQSPCSNTSFELPFVDQLALRSLIAPVGAGCSLIVTGVVANTELRCSSAAVSSGSCSVNSGLCVNELADAGADDDASEDVRPEAGD